jgi:hypothetical protein
MRRAILPALLLLLCVLPGSAQFGARRDANRTVAGWYQRFLRREMDPFAAGWVRALQQGQQPEQVLAGILGSDEYFRLAGGTHSRFIRQLYQDVAGRRPTPSEETFWTRRLWASSRTDVAYDVLMRFPRSWDRDFNVRDPWRDRYDFNRRVDRWR